MDYQITEKIIPAATVYCSEATLDKYSDAMQWIPAQGAEVRALNPGLKCAEPPYEFVEYLDGVWNKDSVDEWLTEIQLPVK